MIVVTEILITDDNDYDNVFGLHAEDIESENNCILVEIMITIQVKRMDSECKDL